MTATDPRLRLMQRMISMQTEWTGEARPTRWRVSLDIDDLLRGMQALTEARPMQEVWTRLVILGYPVDTDLALPPNSILLEVGPFGFDLAAEADRTVVIRRS